jgi:hypothetical protein
METGSHRTASTTTQSSQTITLEPANRKAAFAAISRYIFQALFGLCESQRRFMRAVSGAKIPLLRE